ncbi:hypothetical protein Tco_1200100 [Tanacetum coccineum]
MLLIHNQFMIRSLKSVNTKTPQAKHSVNHTKKVWKATRNHIVNTTKTAWRPTRKVVGSVKPQWKPTGRHFALYDTCPLTRIMEPIVEPLELTPSVSSSSKFTMISRSVGRTVADSSTARLKRATTYVFRWFDLSLLYRPATKYLCVLVFGHLLENGEHWELILRCSIRTVIIDPHGIRG